MSEIKALERLRKLHHEIYPCQAAVSIADEIEAEIAEARETTRKKHRAERVYWHNELHKILDAIDGRERFWGDCMDYPLPEATVPPSEIARCMLAERYMRLPVDADGAPIHVGDVMVSAGIREKGHKVIVSAIFEDGFVEYGSENGLIGPLCQEDWVHAKPRTLEDVLRDVWKEALDYAKSDMWRNPDEVFAERADEIRELLGGEA